MSQAVPQSGPGRPLRVVITKVGLDGHDRGAKVIAQGLRDAGMEVIYAGLRRSPAEICEILLQEDADVVGLSILSGAVVPLTRRVIAEMRERSLDDVLLVVGGITSPRIIEDLNELGVLGVFGPGTPMHTIESFVNEHARR